VDDLAYAVRWATRHGADVINLSVGLDPATVPALSDAVADAVAHGVVVVAAAGNRSQPWCVAPAFDDGAICVTATDRDEHPAVYSSGAVKPDLTSVAAPGGAGLPSQVAAVPYPGCTERILSTWPRNDPGVGRCPGQGGYRYLSGTSLAAPHVCGVMALLLSQGRTRANAIEALLRTARTPYVGTGAWTPSYGHGIVDAAAAVRYPR
jgi:serine protease